MVCIVGWYDGFLSTCGLLCESQINIALSDFLHEETSSLI